MLTLILTWLLVGTGDITYAICYSYWRSGTSPQRLLQSVAAGAVGRDAAFAGGTSTALMGLGFHYFIALTITVIFFLAAKQMRSLVRHPVLTGSLYGIGVYLVMNFIVIPLSKIGPRPLPATLTIVTGVVVHMFVIGTPIAIGARRSFRR